jgi:hypothetical protein
MLSFTDVTNLMKYEATNLEDEEIDEKSKEMIRIGLKIDEDIWENLIRLCNNSDLLYCLFDIPKEKVSKISLNIRKYLDKIKEDHEEESRNRKFKMISTGY